jgi:DNA-binding beta-propeller fold protein YncE
MHFVSERRDHRLVAVGFASIALAFIAVFAFAARAQAAETLYWNNYGSGSVAFSNIDGSGGGALNVGSEVVQSPEGLAYDTLTNRLFVPNEDGGNGHITAINLDGSGASSFTAPGAPIEEPEGIAIDPATRTIYWENTDGEGSIAWAKLDGSAGGVLNTTGAEVVNPCCRLAIDPEGGRIYWMNFPAPNEGRIAYANLNNTGGGGELDLTGSTLEPGAEGLAVDHAAGRIYFLDGEAVGYAKLDGSGGGDLPVGTAPLDRPWGLALDPALGRLYWGNEGNDEERTNAFGFVSTSGTGSDAGGISIATAPVAHPQDPLIIKSPSGTGVPVVTRDATNPAMLSCSTGTWAADYPGGSVYQAPRTYGYQWLLNGTAVSGGTASTLNAMQPGSYTCTVTATNQSGSASQTSGAAATVSAASVKLTVKPKKAKAKPGKLATFKVQALNQGDLATGNAKVCVKVPKKAKKALKAPKCKKLGVVGALAKKTTKLKVKVKKNAAKGSYKLTIQVKGSAGKAVKATVKVLG